VHNRRNRYSSAFRSKNLNLFVQRKELLTLLVFFVKFEKKWCERYLIDVREFQAAKKNSVLLYSDKEASLLEKTFFLLCHIHSRSMAISACRKNF